MRSAPTARRSVQSVASSPDGPDQPAREPLRRDALGQEHRAHGTKAGASRCPTSGTGSVGRCSRGSGARCQGASMTPRPNFCRSVCQPRRAPTQHAAGRGRRARPGTAQRGGVIRSRSAPRRGRGRARSWLWSIVETIALDRPDYLSEACRGCTGRFRPENAVQPIRSGFLDPVHPSCRDGRERNSQPMDTPWLSLLRLAHGGKRAMPQLGPRVAGDL